MRLIERFDFSLMELLPFFLGLILLLFNFTTYNYDVLYFVSLLLMISPIVIRLIKEEMELKEIEDRFPDFVEDLVEAVRSGMPITKAIIYVSKNDYGALTPYVNSLAARIDWGIPLKESLELFAEETRSPLIKRTVNTILEIEKSGGKIVESLEAIVKTLQEIKQLKKEREAAVYQNVIQSYIIFLFFLGTLIATVKFLIPFLSGMSAAQAISSLDLSMASFIKSMLGRSTVNINTSVYLHLALIQGFFAGLAIGKMSEGTIKAGIKHSLILVSLAFFILKMAGF